MRRRVYLDASALVKLTVSEPETRALARHLGDHPDLVTSVVAAVEVPRAIRAIGAGQRIQKLADDVLGRCFQMDLDEEIRNAAATLSPSSLRSLDAIHLASGLRAESELDVFVTYDRRLAEAAQAAGLAVVAPGQ